MIILTKEKFLEMPRGTIFQKVIPNCSNGPLCVKSENCGSDDFWLVELDLVSLMGCSLEQDSTFRLGEGELDFTMERDGMHDDDDKFLCLSNKEKKTLLRSIGAMC